MYFESYKKAAKNYWDRKEKFDSNISKYFSGFKEIDEVYPFPVFHSPKEVAELVRISEITSQAVQEVVENYSDSRIQEILIKTDKEKEAIESLETPYRTNFLRPDYIFDNHKPLVCEINARFVFNGYWLSHYISAGFVGYEAIPGQVEMGNFLKSFPSFECVKNRESGFDIHYATQNTQPIESLNDLNSFQKPVVLELHQDELIPYLPEVCNYVNRGGTVYNDPRSIYLGHDKRMLAVFWDEDIMRDYMNAEDIDFLKKHLIPSYHISGDHTPFEEALNNPDGWMLKRAISGKADGIKEGSKTKRGEWEKLLGDPDFVLQPIIEQPAHKVFDPETGGEEEIFLAGTLPSFDSKSFGPGCYRLLTDDIKFFAYTQPMLEE